MDKQSLIAQANKDRDTAARYRQDALDQQSKDQAKIQMEIAAAEKADAAAAEIEKEIEQTKRNSEERTKQLERRSNLQHLAALGAEGDDHSGTAAIEHAAAESTKRKAQKEQEQAQAHIKTLQNNLQSKRNEAQKYRTSAEMMARQSEQTVAKMNAQADQLEKDAERNEYRLAA